MSIVERAVNAWANMALVHGSDAYIYALRDLHAEAIKYGFRYVTGQYAHYPMDLLGAMPEEFVTKFETELRLEYKNFFGE